MNSSIKISRTSDKVKTFIISITLTAIFYISINSLNLNIDKFLSRLSNAGNIISKLMVVNFSNIFDILAGMLSTIAIAASALFTGLLIAVILSFLAASNIAPNKYISALIKGCMAIIRAVPALVWILMVVASIGFGNTSGMIGLIFPTVGYLTKSFIASIEEMGFDTIEAMKTTGSGWLNIVIKGLIPSLISPFISWISIRMEGNIAESINLGMVGVAGIGSLLMKAIGKYDYGSITAIILVIFITMLIVEILVNKLKSII